MKGKLLIWICPECLWVTVSDQQPHRMDTCRCGKSFVDFEDQYIRRTTNTVTIAEIDLDNRAIYALGEDEGF